MNTKRLLLLRPQQRGEALQAQLVAAGWQVELAPLMQFAPGPDLAAVQPALAALTVDDLLVVASPAVVEALAGYVAAENNSEDNPHPQPWLCAAQLVAVGQATATALLAAGSSTPLVPQDARSEGLLQLPCTLQGEGRKALLLRGSSGQRGDGSKSGGRRLIADTLRQRGFEVEELACYQRQPLPPVATTLARWQQQGFNALALTSCEALDILLTHSNNRIQQWLSQCQWLAASPRIAEYVQQRLAATKVHLAAGASNEQLAQAILSGALSEDDPMQPHDPHTTAIDEASTAATQSSAATATAKFSLRGLWWLVLLLLLVALAVGGWWVGSQRQTQQAGGAALAAELRSGLQQHTEDLQRLEQEIARERKERDDLKAQLERALQRQDEVIAGLKLPQQQRWQLSEVAYLARLANRRLWYEQDINSAIALLNDADRLLSTVDGARSLALRQALGRDLTLLRSLSPLDIDGSRARLSGLQQQALSWPLQGSGVRGMADNVVAEQSHFERSWRALAAEFFTIHREAESAPLLLPEQAHWLRENMRLALQRAQLSLQLRDESGYQAALADVRDWLQRYFDGQAPAVQAAQAELAQLATQPLLLNLPETLEINRLLANQEGVTP